MIIDSKSPTGKRLSVSLDDTLIGFLDLALPKGTTARDYIIYGIKSGGIQNTVDARNETYKKIIKPSLLKRFNDGQMDIEDFC